MAIGLIYVCDYGYAASPENWQTPLYDYSNDAVNTTYEYKPSFYLKSNAKASSGTGTKDDPFIIALS